MVLFLLIFFFIAKTIAQWIDAIAEFKRRQKNYIKKEKKKSFKVIAATFWDGLKKISNPPKVIQLLTTIILSEKSDFINNVLNIGQYQICRTKF